MASKPTLAKDVSAILVKRLGAGVHWRGKPIEHDKRRNRIEIMFGRLTGWRGVATRYDRCPKMFISAVALAATVMFSL